MEIFGGVGIRYWDFPFQPVIPLPTLSQVKLLLSVKVYHKIKLSQRSSTKKQKSHEPDDEAEIERGAVTEPSKCPHHLHNSLSPTSAMLYTSMHASSTSL